MCDKTGYTPIQNKKQFNIYYFSRIKNKQITV